MADDVIDRLSLEIESNANHSEEAIESLAKSLGKLKRSVKGFEKLKLDGFTNSMKGIREALNGIKGVENLEAVSDSLKKISDASRAVKSIEKVKKATSGIKKTSFGIDTDDFDEAITILGKRFADLGKDFKFEGSAEEAEKMIKRLQHTLEGLFEKQNEMHDLGKDVNSEGFVRLQRNIALTTNKLEVLKKTLNEVKKANQKISDSFKVQRADSETSKVNVQEPRKTKVSAESLGYNKEAMQAVYGEAAAGIKNYNDAIKKLGPDASRILNEINTDFKETGDSASEAAEKITRTGEKLKKSLNDAGISAEKFEKYLEDIEIPEIRENNLKKLQSELDRTLKKLDDLETKSDNWAKKGVDPDSTAFRKLQEDIVSSSKKADALRVKIKQIKTIDPSTNGWDGMLKVAGYIEKAFSGMRRGLEKSIASIKKVGKAFTSLYGIIKKVSSAIKSAFGSLAKLATKAASAITSSVKGISSAFAKLSGSGGGLKTASFGLKDLLKTALGFKAVSGLIDFGKSAIELGSDISEVENVVDTAFGSMAQKAYDFASTASEQFGLSELAAKQYSGTMMAMLKSSGVAQDAAADMSITLTGLAGDLASFYNLDTDEAFRKLRAAIAGETEPMKALGVNMNIVNLEAFAMSQGITKAYKDMTLAEQSILRYNYILAKTSDAQGDFARTAGSWANQMRLLKLNLQSISAIIGQGLIAAILPAIKWLNKLMAKLTQAAKVFRDFMYVLTGKKIETTPKGIVDDTAGMVDYTTDLSGIKDDSEEAAEGVDDVSDSMDGAADNAKKLKKALSALPFDQLNQLTGNLDDLDSYSSEKNKNKTGKNDGLDDLGLGDMSDMFDDAFDKEEIQPVNEWARRLREAFLAGDWEGLGKTIAEMLNIGLRKIYDVIKDITPKIEKAIRNLAKVLNAIVKYLDWDLLGRTIGAGVNLLARAFNAFTDEVNGFDFVNLGRKLSVAFRGMVDEIDWKVLGNAIGNGFMVAWRIAYGFVEDMWRINPDTLLTGWAETGIALAKGIEGIFEKINFGMIGTTLSNGFNGIVEIIRNFNHQMAEQGTWSKIAINISEGFNNIIDYIDLSGAAEALSTLFLDLLNSMNQAAEITHWSELGYKIGEFLYNIPWLTIFNQVFDLVAATFGEAMGGFVQFLYTHAEQLGQGFADFFNSIFDRIKYITNNIPWDDIGTGISTFLNTSIAKIRPISAAESLGNFVTSLLGTMLQVAQKTRWHDLGIKIGQFLSTIPWATIFGQVFDTVTTVFGNLLSGFIGYIVRRMPEAGTALAEGFNHAFETLKQFVSSVEWTDIGHNIATGLNNMIHGIDWKTAGETFGDFIKGVIDVIFTVAAETDWVAFGRGIGDFLDGIPWLEILGKVAASIGGIIGEVIMGLGETTSGKLIIFLGQVWATVKGFQLGNKVLGVVNDVAKNFGLLPEGVTSIIPVLTGKIGQIAGNGSGSGGLFSKIATAASTVTSKTGSILGTIGTVIFSPKGLMIAGIVAGVALIIANWDSIKKAAGEIWGAIKTAVTDVWEGLKTAASDIWGGIKTVITDTWDGIKNVAGDVWEGIKTYLSDTWEGVKTVAGDVWEGTKTVISDTWDGLQTIAHDTWGAISTYLTDTWDGLKTVAGDIWGGITTGIGDIWGGLKTVAGDVWGAITGKVSDANTSAENSTSTSWENAKASLNANLSEMNAYINTMMASMAETVREYMSRITSIYTTAWQSIGGMSSAATTQMNADVNAKMTAMAAMVLNSMQQIANVFTNSWKLIGSMSASATAQMMADVNSKMVSMINVVTSSMKTIGNAYLSGWNAAKNTTANALGTMQSTVSSKMNAIKTAVNSALNTIQNTFRTKWTTIGNTVTQSLNKIQTAVTTKMNAIKTTINTSMTSILNTFKTKWNSIGTTCNQALSKMQSNVTSKMNSIKTTVSNSMNSIVTSYKNGLSKMPTATSNILDRVVKMFRELPNRISSAFNGLYRSGQNAAQSFVNGFKSIHIPTPQMYISRWKTHQIGNGKTMQTPVFSVEYLARGGLINGLTPAILGENFKKEAVLPLENPRSMRMIAESIMAEAPAVGMDEEILTNAVARGMAMAMMNNQQAPINVTCYAELKTEDNETLARAVAKGQQNIDYRMNPTPQFG